MCIDLKKTQSELCAHACGSVCTLSGVCVCVVLSVYMSCQVALVVYV